MGNVLIFDFDGVIVDSLEICMRKSIETFKKHNFNKIDSKEKFLSLFEKNFYESFADSGIDKAKIPKVVEDLRISLSKEKNKLQLFYGIEDALKKLSKDNTIFIITANMTEIVEDFLKSKNINFEEVIGADKETSKVKRIVHIKSKYKGNNYFYIGDTKGDIIEGRKAGIKTIAVTWGWHSEDKLKEENPDFIVHSPQELINLFEKSTD